MAGLNINSRDYCTSPPIFRITTRRSETSTTIEDIDIAVTTMFGQTPPKFKPLAIHLLATLLYHSDFHWKVIPQASRFRHTTAFRVTTYRTIKHAVIVCYPWTIEQGDWMVNFTGLTPMALIFQRLEGALTTANRRLSWKDRRNAQPTHRALRHWKQCSTCQFGEIYIESYASEI